MANTPLSTDDIALGRAILLTTDTLGMSTEGAFWLYDEDDDTWRFFLVTSLFSNIDPREIYFCLNAAITKKLSEHEANEFNLYIASPSEHIVQSILRHIVTEPYVSEPIERVIELDGKQVKAVIYRLALEMEQAEVKKVQRRFRRSCKTLTAA